MLAYIFNLIQSADVVSVTEGEPGTFVATDRDGTRYMITVTPITRYY